MHYVLVFVWFCSVFSGAETSHVQDGALVTLAGKQATLSFPGSGMHQGNRHSKYMQQNVDSSVVVIDCP